jgi:hypothetical protein
MIKRVIFYFIISISINPLASGQIEYLYRLDVTKAESLFFIDRTKSFISDYLDLEPNSIDWITIDWKLGIVDFAKLDKDFNDFIAKLDNNEQRTIKKKIDTWHNISVLLNFPYDLDNTELLETWEILSELKQTKTYINQFIIVDGQN